MAGRGPRQGAGLSADGKARQPSRTLAVRPDPTMAHDVQARCQGRYPAGGAGRLGVSPQTGCAVPALTARSGRHRPEGRNQKVCSSFRCSLSVDRCQMLKFSSGNHVPEGSRSVSSRTAMATENGSPGEKTDAPPARGSPGIGLTRINPTCVLMTLTLTSV